MDRDRRQNYPNNQGNFSNNAPRERRFDDRNFDNFENPRQNFNQGNVNPNYSLPEPPNFDNTRRSIQKNPGRNMSLTHHSSFGGRDNLNQGSSRFSRNKTFPLHRSSPYQRNQERYARRGHNIHFGMGRKEDASTSFEKEMTPLEAKSQKLIDAVRSQNGIKGQLVFLQTDAENSTAVLQNALQSIRNGVLEVTSMPNPEKREFTLSINGEKFAEGTFENKQIAKNSMCETVVNELKQYCFHIEKKKNYEEVSTEDLTNTKKDMQPENTMAGSKAHLMMLKMGWGGKGLGSQEQGQEKTVAETIIQNVTKEGLGGKNIMGEIQNILQDFASSSKVTTLAFDSGFTKEERAHIHQIAGRYNLKSKSEGSGENRRITISKKLGRWELVKELLLQDNCENDSYKLTIPSEFENLWLTE